MKHPVRKFVRIAGSEKNDEDHCVKKRCGARECT